MSTDFESRLRSQLQAESDLLPGTAMTVDSVVGRGRQRRRRASFTSAAGALVVVIGAIGFALPKIVDLSQPDELVVADQPDTADGQTSPADSEDRVILDVEDTTAPGVEEDAPAASETESPSPSDQAPSDADRPSDKPTSTSAVLGQLPSEAVLFHSDHDGCEALPDRRAHPDWQQGQSASDRSPDGTPTYGFAYNTGDASKGVLDWGFVPTDFALSGRCVLSMTITGADRSTPAVRIVRRYDSSGRELPADAYYSVWLYFPEEIEVADRGTIDGEKAFGFWTIFQFKNHVGGTPDDSLPTLSFNTGKFPGEDVMTLSVYSKADCGHAEDCPQAETIEQTTPTAIPTKRWVHFEAHLISQSDDSGRLEVWQDGQKIIDFTGKTERPGTIQRTWSVKNMGQLHATSSHTLFADDPLISTEPIYPELFD